MPSGRRKLSSVAVTPYGGAMAPEPGDRNDPQDELESYLGLVAEAAEGRAREHGWTTVRMLQPGAIITMEYLVGRLNFEVEDGTVRRCWKG